MNQPSAIVKTNNVLLTLISLLIVGSLVNTKMFVYESLTPYFLFTLLCPLMSAFVFANWLFVKRKEINLSWPTLVILAWIVWVMISGLLIHTGLTHRSWYILAGCIAFVAMQTSFAHKSFSLQKLYTVIACIATLEALYCIAQYCEMLPSWNHFFAVTGTWTNPNVTAMFLAMAVGPIITYPKKLWWVRIGMGVCVIIALDLLQCRSAWIGAGISAWFVLNYHYGLWQKLADKRHRLRAAVIILTALFVLLPLVIHAYKAKQASADGRLLVYKLSAQMVASKPISGYGYGMLEREYNLHQAAYFETGQASPDETRNAAWVNMAYNEPLENAVEGGGVGLLIFLALLVLLMIAGYHKPMSQYADEPMKTHDDATYTKENRETSGQIAIAFSGIAAFIVMSLGNFTITAIPVFAMFLVYGAIVGSQSASITIRPLYAKAFKVTMVTAAVILLYIVAGFAEAQYLNKKGETLWVNGKTKEAIATLALLENRLPSFESYYANYGRAFMANGEYEKAAQQLKQATTYTSMPSEVSDLAECLGKTGFQNEAEQYYRLAANLEPTRITPRYALMMFYKNSGDTVKMLQTAGLIQQMQPKVESEEVKYYKEEATRLLNTSKKTIYAEHK